MTHGNGEDHPICGENRQQLTYPLCSLGVLALASGLVAMRTVRPSKPSGEPASNVTSSRRFINFSRSTRWKHVGQSAMDLHFAAVWETISDVVPDREALVCGNVRRSWREYDERAARIAG